MTLPHEAVEEAAPAPDMDSDVVLPGSMFRDMHAAYVAAPDLQARAEAAEARLSEVERENEAIEAAWADDREGWIKTNADLKAAEAQRDALVEAAEPFARAASQEDLDHLPDELVISMTYDDSAYDEDLGGPNTLLGEPFLRAFRRLKAAYDAALPTKEVEGE